MKDDHQTGPTSQGKTHQEIVDAIDGLSAKFRLAYNAASAHIEARRADLRHQCGVIGHLFAREMAMPTLNLGKVCVYCGMAEAKEATHG